MFSIRTKDIPTDSMIRSTRITSGRFQLTKWVPVVGSREEYDALVINTSVEGELETVEEDEK